MLDAHVPVCLSVGLNCWMFSCWKSCVNTLYAIPSYLQTSWPPRYLCACLLVQTSWLHRYLCAYRLGPVLEVLRMLDAQVPVCLSVWLKCWMFCCWMSCANTLYAILSYFQTSWPPRYLCACPLVQTSWLHRYLCAYRLGPVLEVLRMLDAQVHVCLWVWLKCWMFCCWKSCANTLYAIPCYLQTSWPPRYLCACPLIQTSWLHRYLCAYRLGPVLEVLRMLDAQIPVCLSVGLKCWMFCCWKSCANTLYACLETSWPHRYVSACLLVGLKCWKLC